MRTVKTDIRDLAVWLNHASMVLGAAGIATPRFDAERLAAYVLGVPWSQMARQPRGVAMHSAPALDGGVWTKLEAVLARRVGGEPLAYIEGSRGFYGLELACGPGVLVPRPETETLVDVALELLDGVAKPIVVDLGTGTGAIALAIGTQRPDAEVVATDVSDAALAYARRNAESLGVDVWLSSGDLFDAVPRDLRERIDLIVSNPPYVRVGTDLPADVKAEPAIALFAGTDGMDVVRRIVAGAPDWLSQDGAFALEIGDGEQATSVRELIPGAVVRADYSGRPRVVWARSDDDGRRT